MYHIRNSYKVHAHVMFIWCISQIIWAVLLTATQFIVPQNTFFTMFAGKENVQVILFYRPYEHRLEWQVFRDTENTEKSRKFSTKRKTRKNVENSVCPTQNKKYQKNHGFKKISKIKFISDLLNCSQNLTKNSQFICQCGI